MKPIFFIALLCLLQSIAHSKEDTIGDNIGKRSGGVFGGVLDTSFTKNNDYYDHSDNSDKRDKYTKLSKYSITDKEKILSNEVPDCKNLVNESAWRKVKNLTEARYADQGKYESGLRYLSSKFYEDREFILKATKICGYNFVYGHKKFRDDKELLLLAIQQDGEMIEIASNDLHDDKEFIKSALEKNGYAFKFIKDSFKNDKELIKTATRTYPIAVKYANDEIKSDKNFILELADINYAAAIVDRSVFKTKEFKENYRKNKERVKSSLETTTFIPQSTLSYRFADNSLKSDPEIKTIALRASLYNATVININTDELRLEYLKLIDEQNYDLLRTEADRSKFTTTFDAVYDMNSETEILYKKHR